MVLPEDAIYKQSQDVFNQSGNPAVIVQVKNQADIGTTIQFARENKLSLSVRSGGHGFCGLATNVGGNSIRSKAFG